MIITGRNEKAVNDAVKELGKGASGIISDGGNMNDINTLKEKVEAITSTVDILCECRYRIVGSVCRNIGKYFRSADQYQFQRCLLYGTTIITVDTRRRISDLHFLHRCTYRS